MTRDIVTYYEPMDGYWRAYRDGAEPDDNGQIKPLGMGKTEQEAIEELEDAPTTR